MTNRIRSVEIVDQVLTPAQAVLLVVVTPNGIGTTTEIRGRFMGPRCCYASTVEVAYSLRVQPGSSQSVQLLARVVIPEPSFWEPESPFLYHGVVELWENGERCDRTSISHGLRSVSLGGRGLRVNGRKLTLRGRHVEHCRESEAMALRQREINLWIVPVQLESMELWNLADQLGFFILGRVTTRGQQDLVASLDRRASSLGWIVAADSVEVESRGLIGQLEDEPFGKLRSGSDFVICSPNQEANVGLPFLVVGLCPTTPAGDEVLCLGTVEKT